ncbi:MAG: hypothetical protein AB7N91_15100 [Candidatus Tectimicrobiota bacterium]
MEHRPQGIRSATQLGRWSVRRRVFMASTLMLCSFILLPRLGVGVDTAERARMLDIGGQSCEQLLFVLRQRDFTPETRRYYSWIDGYLTAVQTYVPGTDIRMESRTLSDVLRRLDSYCMSYPRVLLATALPVVLTRFAQDTLPTRPQ